MTLQDVADLLGLRIDGRPVTALPTTDLRATCHELLSVIPDRRAIDGARLRFT